jgi:hypothetical protein
MDSNICPKTWIQCHHRLDIWVRKRLSPSVILTSNYSPVHSEYLNRLFFHATAADASPDAIPQWAIKFTASIAVIIVSILCVATPRLATRVAVLFTSVKVRCISTVSLQKLTRLLEDCRTCELIASIPQRVLIRPQLSVAVMGIIQLTRGKTSTSLKEGLFEGTSPNPSAYALALFSGLWAYEGWDQGI